MSATPYARDPIMRARTPEWQATAGEVDPAGASAWLPWLVRMRWAAVLGQLLTVGVARWALGLDIHVAWLLAIVAFTAASNLVLAAFLDRLAGHASEVAAAVIALDVVLLTTLLGLSGGAANPFSVLYLVHVSLAALLFGFRWSLAIAALCAAGYATIFSVSAPLGWEHDAHAGHMGHGANGIGLHLQGMWAATVVAALILSYFVARTAAALREREAQLRALERAASRNEKLVALSALAAGAAHELGSPLGTIAIAASELDRAARNLPGAERLAEDARLIREQAARCREILARMSGESGADVGDGLDEINLAALLDAVRARLDANEAQRVEIPLRGTRNTAARAFDRARPGAGESRPQRIGRSTRALAGVSGGVAARRRRVLRGERRRRDDARRAGARRRAVLHDQARRDPGWASASSSRARSRSGSAGGSRSNREPGRRNARAARECRRDASERGDGMTIELEEGPHAAARRRRRGLPQAPGACLPERG